MKRADYDQPITAGEMPHCCPAKSSRPESDEELGLIHSSKIGGPEGLGMKTNGVDQKPNGPAKGSVSASSARKKASDFGGDFRFG